MTTTADLRIAARVAASNCDWYEAERLMREAIAIYPKPEGALDRGTLAPDANARLIAAAPELLAAIKAHLAASPGPDYQGHRDQRDIDVLFRAAIAKSEGKL